MPLKTTLFLISTSLIGCSQLPPFPEVYQCGAHADVNPPGYYCVDTKTKAREYRPFDDPKMKGAQAVSADDAKKIEKWAEDVKQIAEKKCNPSTGN